MTRLRLLKVETTEPKDKWAIRYKKCSSVCVKKGWGEKKATTNHYIFVCLPPGGKTVCKALKTRESG